MSRKRVSEMTDDEIREMAGAASPKAADPKARLREARVALSHAEECLASAGAAASDPDASRLVDGILLSADVIARHVGADFRAVHAVLAEELEA